MDLRREVKLSGNFRFKEISGLITSAKGRLPNKVHESHCNNTVRYATHCRTLYLSMYCFVYDFPGRCTSRHSGYRTGMIRAKTRLSSSLSLTRMTRSRP